MRAAAAYGFAAGLAQVFAYAIFGCARQFKQV
jgi:hypothetical protein